MNAIKTGRRLVCAALAAVLVLLGLAVAFPGKAHADDLDGVARSVSGTCYIGDTWMVGSQSFFTIPSFSGALSGAVPSTTFECLDHTAAAPDHVNADYSANLVDYSVSEGWVEYYVTIIPPDVTDGVTSNEYGLVGYQRVGGRVRVPHEFNGELTLAKSSAMPGVTDGNACYSLAGAVYEVYSARGSDGTLSGKVGELTSDASGKTGALTLRAGAYFVKESAAPQGYLIDAETHQVTVSAGRTATLELSDRPANDPTGALVQKVDAVTGKNVPVGDGSLAGAEITFRYYAGYYGGEGQPAIPARADRTWVMRTDANGYANITYEGDFVAAGDDFYTNASGAHILPLGTITAIETAAPEGYLMNEPSLFITQIQYDASGANGVKRTKVNYEGVATTGNLADAARIDEQPQRGNVELTKRDPQTADGTAQGDATLAGAVFDVVNASRNAVVSPQTGAEVAPGGVVCQIVTDATGYASTTRADLNGWAVPDGWGGKALDYGTYTVRESRAPTGYNLNSDWSGTAVIDSDGKTVPFNLTDDVVCGGVAIGKVDRGNGGYLPEGTSTLAGATFTIYNIGAADVVVDGVQYASGKAVATITTVEDGGRYVASTSVDALPYSTYELRESGTSTGYLLDYESRTWRKQFEVRAHEVVDLTDEGDAVANQVIRGDLFFNKVHEATMGRLAGVPFKVTSKTTGEWHVIVTDENGQVSTASDWNSHLTRTNSNDGAIGADGKVDESKLDPLAGVWFHGRTDSQAAVSDDLGALPFDTYVLTELQCEANKGLTPVEFEVTVSRDGRELDLGTVDDHEAPSLGTQLTGPDGIHIAPSSADSVLVDTVAFNDLPAGAYVMEGELHLVGPDGSDQGVVATSSKGFTASASSGEVEVAFRLDTTELGGRSLVAFERAVAADGTVVARHEDIADEGQTLSVPEVGTTLTDAADGDHEASSVGTVTLVDSVSYSGLESDKAYSMSAALRLRGEGGEDLGPAKDASGSPITSSQVFTPTAPSGTVEVTFTFVPDATSGATVVAFEELLYNGRSYAAHADITDDAQSVDIPWMGTTATDSSTGEHVGIPGGEVSIVDVVAYEKLRPGTEYTVSGELHSRGADGRDLGAVADADGNPVTAERTFTPGGPSGSVELNFEGAVDGMAGSTFVAFETLVRDGKPVASHADIADEGQTVHYPKIGTTAVDSGNGTHTSPNDGEATILDLVAYENLAPGVEYTVRGTLHVRAQDGADGGEALDASGKPVTAEMSFTPTEPSGTVDLTFTVDGPLLAGKTVVAFESVCAGGVEVAAHADIGDSGQSVSFPASIQTTAVSADTGSQTMALGEAAEIVDTVAYWNLVPGEAYVLAGEVHVKGSDGTDGGVLEVGGEPVAASARFMPETPDGLAEVRFEVDTTAFAGTALVVYEELETADGAHIASHADITDAGQTVSVPTIGTTATDKASGGHDGVAAVAVTVVDEVAYEGLTPGRTYRAEGVLYDKGTGEPYLVKGDEVTAVSEFVAEAAAGKAAIEFEFDGTALAGAQLVAFERLYDASGVLVAVHEDIDDENQTVSYRSPGKSIVTKITQDAVKFYDRTVDWLLGHWPVLLVAGCLVAVGIVLFCRGRRKRGEGPTAGDAE